jgi:hypothetical protein
VVLGDTAAATTKLRIENACILVWSRENRHGRHMLVSGEKYWKLVDLCLN